MPKILVGKHPNTGDPIYGEFVEDYEVQREDWNINRLPDGTVVRVKTVVTGIIKTDLVNDAGEPIYVVRSQPIIDSRPTPTPTP